MSVKQIPNRIPRLLHLPGPPARLRQVLIWRRAPLVGLVSYMRWAIPTAVSFLGVAYVLLEDAVIQGHALSEPSVIRSVLVIGLAGPALVWLTLTWAAQAAMAEADAQKELALRNREAQRRAVHLQTASYIAQQMIAFLDLNSLLAEVVRLIRLKFDYDHTHILLVDEERNELVLREAGGPHAESIKARGLRLTIGSDSITGWVAQTGQILLCSDVTTEPRYYATELVPETQSELAVPLRVGNRIVGVLDVQSNRKNAFDKEDVTVLHILANQVGIAIENARLFEETKRRYSAMIALHETSIDMIAQLDMSTLLNGLLRRGTELLNAKAGALFLYDAQRGVIRNIVSYNTSRDRTGTIVPLGEGVSGQVVLTGMPLIVNDYDTWDGRSELFAGDLETRVVGVPIGRSDQTLGAILVMNDAQARPFDRDDQWLLSHFADLASIAIENAKLHTQVKNFSQDLERSVAERTRELSNAKEEIAAKAAQLRSLLAKTISIQEEERARIARDMHDGVVQLITAARYELQAAKVVTGESMPAAAQEKINAARQVLEEAEEEIRHAIYDLHSPILDEVGLVPALQQYAARFHGLSGITCHVHVSRTPNRLPIETQVAVFRMIEAALQNVAKHSGATTVHVNIEPEPDSLVFAVEDDGCGFDYPHWLKNHNGNHLGLLGMQERAENLGGAMEVWSAPGRGTRVAFRLPIKST
jgi:signal transduction histidine kinase